VAYSLSSRERGGAQVRSAILCDARQQSDASFQIVDTITTIAAGASETATGLSQTKEGLLQLNKAAESLRAIAS